MREAEAKRKRDVKFHGGCDKRMEVKEVKCKPNRFYEIKSFSNDLIANEAR
jgi:hypothetical protein